MKCGKRRKKMIRIYVFFRQNIIPEDYERKILKKHHKEVIRNDKKAIEVLPEGACYLYGIQTKCQFERTVSCMHPLILSKVGCVRSLRDVLGVKPNDVIVVKIF